MGAYLSAPDTRKESEGGECRDGFTYGCSSMQGWRRSQEDAHIACDLPDGTTVFGVFDGHGGREVSAFAKRHFGKVLASQPQFSSDLPASLIGSFHRIDEMLEDKDNLPEVRALKKDPRVPADEGADASSSADKDAADDEGASGKGKVSITEAVDLFQKIVSLKRQQAASASSGAVVASGTAGAAADEEVAVRQSGAAASGGPSSALLAGGGLGGVGGGAAAEALGRQVCSLPPSHIDAGATSVVAAVRGRTLFVANAGDSRAILSRRGKAIPLSTDHKPALSSEMARITSAGGFVTAQGRVNGNLNLSRALGDLKYKVDKTRGRHEQIITAHPDVTTHTIEKGDEFMVLACDGVWDCMTNQQVVDFVRERIRSTPLPEICEQILDHCIADDPKTTGGIGGDNMTCIIVNLAVPTEKGPPIWTR
jgi:serine/threonine protein phosphatase PrpC